MEMVRPGSHFNRNLIIALRADLAPSGGRWKKAVGRFVVGFSPPCGADVRGIGAVPPRSSPRRLDISIIPAVYCFSEGDSPVR